ncbi:FAD-binding oxidoreductase [Chondromyces apiculatus]|uniref:4-cresol dehydrogenase [hydroxylating] flavoprotein subunit n=1 Tax=Chondromyces apiculatus DSM 436 TaxID=1192034 RepID=A0A017T406_9BACT|nr:FAD-binding oxidoreductase [Chondromyces apiculatus]EYF03727.1 4-cresol dehydrogenase [hydroxylating] flavoprotein subunit [Chondromyces apiculatus DSM 436]
MTTQPLDPSLAAPPAASSAAASTSLAASLAAFRAAIGAEHVRTDEATRASAETATFATTHRIPAVLSPASAEEVEACVRIAHEHRVALYPVSTGKNWGYGSRVPASDGGIVLSLARLNRIVEFSEELAYVTIEPGVTMRQLVAYLRGRGSRLMLSVTGSTPDSSVVGNICDRGFGAGVNAERIAHICNLEVILPTGERLRTGFGRFPGAQTAPIHRWGVGPQLDGLFTQSNLGIVTRMTVWLAPLPKHHEIFYFRLRDEARIEAVTEVIRDLKLQGLPRASVSLWNDYKLVSMKGQYPFREAAFATPLPEPLLATLRRAWGGAAWLGGGAILAASEDQIAAERAVLQKALRPHVDKLSFVGRRAARVARVLQGPVQRLTGFDLGEVVRAYEQSPHLGIPMERNIRSAYWRKKTPPPEQTDPDRDRCGAIWLAPAVPSTGKHVTAALRTIRERTLSHRFEPGISVIFATERCANIVVAFMYDREIPGEDERAMACYQDVFDSLAAQGYLPYRLGIQSMGSLPAAQPGYGAVVEALKRALDPHDILSPGRYDFRGEWPSRG